METSDCIKTRRSIRKYQAKKVSQGLLEKVLESARHAPTSDDSNSTEFIIITKQDTKEKLSELHPWAKHARSAPIIIAVCGNLTRCNDEFRNTINASLAMQNLLLEAHNQGLGSCCIEVINKEFEIEEKVRKILKVPEEVLVHCLVALGYAAESPQEKPKYAFIHHEYYSS